VPTRGRHVAVWPFGPRTAAIALSRRPGPALDVVAAAALLLLFIGIHNAWDAAVWIAAKRQ
jgi:hypothetical protein